ncbi:RHS repeat-associated core domain-containing protein [Candidatus Dependentiae bacterium]|nr:RHS repeat-associated core domain-containing protein [Candidatus Dependentiae bacterium]
MRRKIIKIIYEYDDGSNRLNRVNFNRENDDLSYMLINYDTNGNTIQRDYFRNKNEIFEQELYEYNYDNMMIRYVRHKPVMKNNRIEMEIESELNMKYDVNGMRVIKECYPNTGDSTIYIYEGGEVVLEMTYEQVPKNKHLFTYSGGKKVSRTSFKEDGTIDLDSRKYFHQNFLGSIAMITDKDGNTEEHNKYEPFGDIIWSKSYINTDNNYKFTGKERDKESNLDYFNARYLDTKLGRFMKADVVTGNIKNPQDLNIYIYVTNNPLKFIDKNGNWRVDQHGNPVFTDSRIANTIEMASFALPVPGLAAGLGWGYSYISGDRYNYINQFITDGGVDLIGTLMCQHPRIANKGSKVLKNIGQYFGGQALSQLLSPSEGPNYPQLSDLQKDDTLRNIVQERFNGLDIKLTEKLGVIFRLTLKDEYEVVTNGGVFSTPLITSYDKREYLNAVQRIFGYKLYYLSPETISEKLDIYLDDFNPKGNPPDKLKDIWDDLRIIWDVETNYTIQAEKAYRASGQVEW